MTWPVELHQETQVESTNAIAMDMAKEGAPTGTVVKAESQTAGRGRMNRRWESPVGGLWFSLIFQGVQLQHFHSFQLVAALAISETIEALSEIQVGIRWPNDIMVNDAKLGGILTEVVESEIGTHAAVMGIGINVNNDPVIIQEKISGDKVTSLQSTSGKELHLDALLQQILSALETYYNRYQSGHYQELLQAVSERNILTGKQVTVQMGEETIVGCCTGLQDDGALEIEVDGHKQVLYAGHVRELRPTK